MLVLPREARILRRSKFFESWKSAVVSDVSTELVHSVLIFPNSLSLFLDFSRAHSRILSVSDPLLRFTGLPSPFPRLPRLPIPEFRFALFPEPVTFVVPDGSQELQRGGTKEKSSGTLGGGPSEPTGGVLALPAPIAAVIDGA